jgi:hypothetical protein
LELSSLEFVQAIKQLGTLIRILIAISNACRGNLLPLSPALPDFLILRLAAVLLWRDVSDDHRGLAL